MTGRRTRRAGSARGDRGVRAIDTSSAQGPPAGGITDDLPDAGHPARRLRDRIRGARGHRVTIADGPRGFASDYAVKGEEYAKRLTVPGDYRLFCSLHPVDMAQVIRVRPRG